MKNEKLSIDDLDAKPIGAAVEHAPPDGVSSLKLA